MTEEPKKIEKAPRPPGAQGFPLPQGMPFPNLPPGTQVSLEYSGPLPPAAELAKYESITPGLADRIVGMAERQASHRQRLEERAFAHDARRSWGGLAAGWTVAVSCFAGAVFLVNGGHPVSGTLLGTVDLAALVAVFVLGRQGQKKDDAKEGDED